MFLSTGNTQEAVAKDKDKDKIKKPYLTSLIIFNRQD